MITSRTGGGPVTATQPLGGYVSDQLLRLCQAMGLEPSDGEIYARVLTDCLGPVAERPLDEPPSYPSFLSDDHTPVEYSLAFVPDAPPTLRVLLEPGYGAEGLAENGRVGLRVVRAMAERWGFATDQLDRLEDLFFPPDPEGPLALWLALELRPGGVPKVKVYLNPAASGADRASETVREALDRLGHRQAFAALPRADGYPFFALDLGDWETPRVKVYVTHRNLAAADAGELSRTDPGPRPETVREFLRVAAGLDSSPRHPGAGNGVRLEGRPVLSCHSFTESGTGLPSGFTLHVPVRDYVRHDGEAYARAVAVLRRHGMDTAALDRSLATVTSRLLHDGVGLIAYLALVYERGRPPRVTAYISSEAYAVRPPL